MFPSTSVIKENARLSLRGKWGQTTAVTFIFLSCVLFESLLRTILKMIFRLDSLWSPLSDAQISSYSAAVSAGISLFSFFYLIFILAPLFFGVVKWFWLISEDTVRPVSCVFFYFTGMRVYFRTVRISLALFFRLLLLALLSFSPIIVIDVITNPEIYNALGLSMPLFISSIKPMRGFIVFICAVLLFILSFQYVGVYIAVIEKPELNAWKTVSEGKRITKGLRSSYLYLLLHFIPWIFLSIFMLPALYSFPYFMTSIVTLGRYILFNSKTHQNNKPAKNTVYV